MNSVHSMLIEQAAKWLQKKGCAVVITDMTHAGSETPDAIGWKGRHSILIECKASADDYRADRQKTFRQLPESGMGEARYFCAPRGVINPTTLPPEWGLLELVDFKLRETVKAEPVPRPALRGGAREEVSILLSAIRRIAQNAPSGMSVRFYTFETKNRASMGVAMEPEAQPI